MANSSYRSNHSCESNHLLLKIQCKYVALFSAVFKVNTAKHDSQYFFFPRKNFLNLLMVWVVVSQTRHNSRLMATSSTYSLRQFNLKIYKVDSVISLSCLFTYRNLQFSMYIFNFMISTSSTGYPTNKITPTQSYLNFATKCAGFTESFSLWILERRINHSVLGCCHLASAGWLGVFIEVWF